MERTKEMGLLSTSLFEDKDELKSIIEGMKPDDFGKFKM